MSPYISSEAADRDSPRDTGGGMSCNPLHACQNPLASHSSTPPPRPHPRTQVRHRERNGFSREISNGIDTARRCTERITSRRDYKNRAHNTFPSEVDKGRRTWFYGTPQRDHDSILASRFHIPRITLHSLRPLQGKIRIEDAAGWWQIGWKL